MSDIFEEVEEDLRRDRTLALWKKYGPYAVGAGLAIVAIAAGIAWYVEYRNTLAERAAAQFVAAADLAAGPNKPRALSAFATIIRDAPTGYATVARFYEGAIKGQTADHAAAVAEYRALAADSSVLRELRDAATLLAAVHLAITAGVAEIEREVAPIAGADNPWRHVARELIGVVALKSGDLSKARQMFTVIADDPGAPQSLRGRAAELLAALGA